MARYGIKELFSPALGSDVLCVIQLSDGRGWTCTNDNGKRWPLNELQTVSGLRDDT